MGLVRTGERIIFREKNEVRGRRGSRGALIRVKFPVGGKSFLSR